MKALTPFERQQQIKAQIYGSYNQAAPIKKSEEEKSLEAKKEEAPESVDADEAEKEQSEEEKEAGTEEGK